MSDAHGMRETNEVERFSPARRTIVDALSVGWGRHMSHALIELDVTRARQLIHLHKVATGETLSFTAFIARCVARAIDADKHLHAYRDWRNRLVLFDDVDVVILVEAAANTVAIPHIVRAANRKTVRDIHDDIRRIQSQPARSAQRSGWLMRLSTILPGAARRLFLRSLRKNPAWLKRTSGTVVVSSVGMFGRGGGWALAIVPLHTLAITVGGVQEKPWVVAGRIEAREILDVTIAIDHDVVDGAPAARFVQRFRDLVESADGVPEAIAASTPREGTRAMTPESPTAAERTKAANP
jgi:pyruvate/2-oxoglutarate dehydrogenase complex dihydrolipoamide acyltransferase (E2) component